MYLKIQNNIGTCPLCGESMTHNYDDYDDGEHTDVYSCYDCGIGVYYISPDDGRGEYHEYRDCEIKIRLERD